MFHLALLIDRRKALMGLLWTLGEHLIFAGLPRAIRAHRLERRTDGTRPTEFTTLQWMLPEKHPFMGLS
jgi:hypothetical protein